MATKLPESTHAASLTSEPEKLLPVIQADREAYLSLNMLPPEEAAAVRAGKWDKITGLQIFARHRLSSPVSGTDMVMVPREPTEAMLRAGNAWSDLLVESTHDMHQELAIAWRAMLSASPSTPIPVIAEAGEREARRTWLIERLLYGVQFYVDAEAKREDVASLVDSLDESDEYDPFVAALVQMPKWVSADDAQDAVDAALSTPATLDNAAVEDTECTPPLSPEDHARIMAAHNRYMAGKPSAGAFMHMTSAGERAIIAWEDRNPEMLGRAEAAWVAMEAVRREKMPVAASERERVARIIDPDAWHHTLPTDGCGEYWGERRAKALSKAEAVLSTPTTLDNTAVEVARVAAFKAIYGKQADPFTRPEAYEYASEVADAVLATLTAKTEKAK